MCKGVASCYALINLYSGRDRLGNFAVYGDGCVRTDQRADRAACAAVLENVGRMVAFGGQALHVQFDHVLRTGVDTQFATFTVPVTDFNPAFSGHSLLLIICWTYANESGGIPSRTA